MYEQITHDQALYCANQIAQVHRDLATLVVKADSQERRNKAKRLDSILSTVGTKCSMLAYMYNAAGRNDLTELIYELNTIGATEATTAMIDPEGWREACSVVGSSPEPRVTRLDDEIRDWRVKFMATVE